MSSISMIFCVSIEFHFNVQSRYYVRDSVIPNFIGPLMSDLILFLKVTFQKKIPINLLVAFLFVMVRGFKNSPTSSLLIHNCLLFQSCLEVPVLFTLSALNFTSMSSFI